MMTGCYVMTGCCWVVSESELVSAPQQLVSLPMTTALRAEPYNSNTDKTKQPFYSSTKVIINLVNEPRGIHVLLA